MLDIFPTPLFGPEWWATVILFVLWVFLIQHWISQAVASGILKGHKLIEEYKKEQAKKNAEAPKP